MPAGDYVIYSLTGTNWLLKKARLDELVGSFTAEYGDLALEKIDAEESAYSNILGAIESLPFLVEKKMVVVRNLSANKEASEMLAKLVERAGESTELIIVESKLDKRSVYYKQLKKLTEFKEYNELDDNQLVEWLTDTISKKGGQISRSDGRYIVERAGPNQTALAQEIEKLIQYDPKVTRKTIDLLIDEQPTSSVFNLLDSAFSGDLKRASQLYQEQRMQKVEPQAIHAMLVWQMHAVVVVSTAPKNKSSQDIAKDSGLNPFVVQKSQKIARRMDRTKINQFLKLLRDIDYQSKRTTIDYDDALRYALIQLSS